MIPRPTAIALILREKVIVEEGARNVSLVNCFTKLNWPRFPSVPVSFSGYAALTNANGTGTIKLMVTRLDTDETLDRWESTVHFPDRFAEVRVRFRIRDLSFPAAGRYQFTLLADNEWLAQRTLQVNQQQAQS